jgi:translation initiation factor 2 subunit 1
MVIRVDKEKKYIDLSKRRVSGEDIRRCDERFNKSKTVHGVLRHVATKLGTRILSLYQRVAWPLSRKYGHALDAFQLSITDPVGVFGGLAGVSEEEKAEILDFVKLRMTPQPNK